VNFLGDEGASRVRSAYGDAKYERLTALKQKWDPSNFLRHNQNIEPRVPSRAQRSEPGAAAAAAKPSSV